MKPCCATLALLLCAHALGAGVLAAGCETQTPTLDFGSSDLLARGMTAGRKLLQWRPCYEIPNTKIYGEKNWIVREKRPNARRCCVMCKDTSGCIAWSFKEATGACKAFNDTPGLVQYEFEGHTAGVLYWRMAPGTIPPVFEQPVDIPAIEEPTEPEPLPVEPTPLPPNLEEPSKYLENKVIYGRRLNSYLPCKGNVAKSADDCASKCSGDNECKAWTFAPDFNCGWLGDSQPKGLCYTMADVAKNNIFDAGKGETFFSGWA